MVLKLIWNKSVISLRKWHFLIFLFSNICYGQLNFSPMETHKPLYEIGAGSIYVNFPDYPGSSHNRNLTIPFPVFIYRGEVLRADEDGGIRGRFWDKSWIELNISFGGNLPANSEDNPTRSGMPDLNWVGEVGPSLIMHLLSPKESFRAKLDLFLPLRLAFSTDLKFTKSRGHILNPYFVFRYEGILTPKTQIMSILSGRFASKGLMDYFYTVEPEFATPLRPEFSASGGLMDINLSLGLSHPFTKNIWAFAGVVKSLYNWAENTASPLLAKRSTTAYALGIVWMFHHSEQIVVERKRGLR